MSKIIVAAMGLLLVGCAPLTGAENGEAVGTEAEALATPPPELTLFAKAVSAASKRARAAGSRGCGVAIKPVLVTTATLPKAINSFVSGFRNVPVGTDPQPTCGVPGKAVCADLFQNVLFHNDARMGTELMPSARQVDSMATNRLVTVHPSTAPVAASIAGIRAGWLMGVAWFHDQPTCP